MEELKSQLELVIQPGDSGRRARSPVGPPPPPACLAVAARQNGALTHRVSATYSKPPNFGGEGSDMRPEVGVLAPGALEACLPVTQPRPDEPGESCPPGSKAGGGIRTRTRRQPGRRPFQKVRSREAPWTHMRVLPDPRRGQSLLRAHHCAAQHRALGAGTRHHQVTGGTRAGHPPRCARRAVCARTKTRR
jgi:hypothetical protein